MKANKDTIITNDLREKLKALMQQEIEHVPTLLKDLDTEKRSNALCRLMPYVFPKVDAVSAQEGEPFTW